MKNTDEVNRGFNDNTLWSYDFSILKRKRVRRGKAGRAGGGRPPCPACSSPSRPPARRPRETARRSPSEEEEEAAAHEAPPPWRASRPGGLRGTYGGFVARAVPAGRRPPGAPGLGPLAAAALALALGLRVRGGRAVAESGPHQDPLVRQHGQRAGAAGRRRHRAPCGAPGPRRRYAAGHRAQVRSHDGTD
ncbi:lysM and putative peptidoglycan-binding domain-containing protein 2 isoform X2 [Mustela putorius furo]|uniref:LysM and putative peptidoglycan-binding domain-containing protein 2 isoform X2 n=1 Tax=Mustela putorius furo TaxID=9669 RepID=A0A8U0RGI4_MUSPF|nr:lysM and putative peptidoglycan-binding domain-containing protein 2 isoform X2 [Mustela putorius furo]